jgi:hypothetical protein
LAQFTTVEAGCGNDGAFTTTPPNAADLSICDDIDISLTYSADDGCTSDSVTASFKATAGDIIDVSCPNDYTVQCGEDVQAAFTAWIAGFGYTGGCSNATVTDLSGYTAPLEGEELTINFEVSDNCSNDSCSATFIYPNCGAPHCTYTQGFYGNVGGTACLPDGTTTSAQGIMINALTNAGGVVYFGSMISGNYFELKLSDINGNPTPGQNNIFKMLPGGGTPRALIDYATYDIFATWSDNDPLYASGKKVGKINNNLLSQTMTLFFNMDIESDLALIDLEPVFATADVNCGSDVVIPDTTQIFNIPQSVIDYLNNNGGATVGNLYILANKALAGDNIGGLSHSEINAAVDAINRGYDACRIKVAVPVEPEPEPLNIASADFNIYPVPFNNDITIQYLFKYSSPVEIQIFDAKGALVMTEKDPDAYFNKEIKLRLSFSHGKGEMFFVKLITKTGVSIKKIISTNK